MLLESSKCYCNQFLLQLLAFCRGSLSNAFRYSHLQQLYKPVKSCTNRLNSTKVEIPVQKRALKLITASGSLDDLTLMLFQALHKFLTQDLMWQSDLWYFITDNISSPPALRQAPRSQSSKHQDSIERQATSAPGTSTVLRPNDLTASHTPTPGQSLSGRERSLSPPQIFILHPSMHQLSKTY